MSDLLKLALAASIFLTTQLGIAAEQETLCQGNTQKAVASKPRKLEPPVQILTVQCGSMTSAPVPANTQAAAPDNKAESSLKPPVLVDLLGKVAWPLVVLIICLLFRNEIRSLCGRISQIKISELEAKFEQGLAETERLVKASVPALLNSSLLSSELQDPGKYEEVARLARTSPRSAIMDAWRELELAAVTAGHNSNVPITGKLGRVSGIAAIDNLHSAQLITTEVKELYMHLRELRSQANHAVYEMNIDDAKRYAKYTLKFAEWLRAFHADKK